jgi:hypothetical protein
MSKPLSASAGATLSPADKTLVEDNLRTAQEAIERNNLHRVKIQSFDEVVDPPPPPPPPPPPGSGD